MNIKELGRNLATINEDFYKVNHGGCGCIAAIIAKTFRHTFPIMRITSTGMFEEANNIDHIRTKLCDNLSKREWGENGAEFYHVWVEIFFKNRWYALDATGIHSRKEMLKLWGKAAEGSFSIIEMEAFAKYANGWNHRFNRKQLPAIKRVIKQIGSNYVKSNI
jgi:hypothetical protein